MTAPSAEAHAAESIPTSVGYFLESLTPNEKYPSNAQRHSTTSATAQSESAANDRQHAPDSSLPRSSSFCELYRFASCGDYLLLTIGCVMAIANGALYPCMAILFGDAISSFEPLDLDAIKRVALTYLGIAIALFVSDYAAHVCFVITAEKQMQKLRSRCFEHLLYKEIAWFDGHAVNELTTHLASTTLTIKDGMGVKLGEVLRFVSQFLAGYTIGFSAHYGVSLVMAAIMPLLALCLSWLIKTLRERTAFSQSKYAEAGAIAEETLSAIRTVASFNGEKRAVAKYAAHAKSAEVENIRLARVVSVVVGIVFGTIWLTYAAGLWYGAKLVSTQTISPKVVFSAFYGILLGTISLAQVSPNLSAVTAAKAAAAQMYAILDEPSMINAGDEREGVTPVECIGEIEVRNVTFAYPMRPDAVILKDFSLKVAPGETVALVGPSGGGKSTLFALLQRFYESVDGEIVLDGVEISTLQLKWLRRQIGIVAQEPVLFATSIFENIAASILDRWSGNGEDADTRSQTVKAKVEEAAKLANAHEFILSLPEGYDTKVGEKGVALSGGQKQRIAIARALVRDPKLLLLDEATSALDPESEAVLQDALESLMANTRMTTVVIAHRLSTTRQANRICVVVDGSVLESGSHNQLMGLENGRYRALIENSRVEEMQQRNASLCWKDSMVVAVHPDSCRDSEIPRLGSTAVMGDLPSDLLSLYERGSHEGEGELALMGNPVAELVDTAKLEQTDHASQNFSVSRLMQASRPEREIFVLGIIAAALNGLTHPASAILLSAIVSAMVTKYARFQETLDEFYLDELYEQVRIYSIFYIGGGIAIVFINFTQSFVFKYMGEKLVSRLRNLHFRALCRQDMAFFDRPGNATGSLAGELATLSTMATTIAGDSQGRIIQAGCTFIAALLISFFMGSWLLSLIMCAVFPMLIFADSIRMNQMKGTEQSKRQAASPTANATTPSTSASAIASEALHNTRTVATFGMEKHFAHKHQELLLLGSQRTWRQAHVNGIALGFSSFASFAVYALIFWYGGILVDRKEITFAELMRSLMAIMISANGIGQATSYLGDMEEAKRAARQIFEMKDRVPAIDAFSREGQRCEPLEGNIEFQDVLFAYPTRPSAMILRGLCLHIEAGQTVALCGPSGGGKSTLVALLERFYDPLAGGVWLDGTPLEALNVRWLRSQIGLIGQEPVLFSGSIYDNIAYGKQGDCTADQVESAARLAHAHGFISAFPDGYATLLGGLGEQLSGGQKQRIAIARAILKDPKILLLDEATSALDAASEQMVQDALDRLIAMKQRTTLIVAHRLRTIRHADKICVIANGLVAEAGTHEQLLRLGGMYTKLVEKDSRETSLDLT